MKRFIIISHLSEQLSKLIVKEQKKLFNLTGSKEALLYPPHITLRTGALVPEDKIEHYLSSFQNNIIGINPFYIKSNSCIFDTYIFEGKKNYFIGYSIFPEAELISLHKRLWDFSEYAKPRKKDFNPHISLAYKDLSFEKFEEAKKNWQPSITQPLEGLIDSISLYHFKNECWTEYIRFYLDIIE